tara:strand:- start:14 stop:604 length:591 start_codon:yes stop_codon:yes gene_type:complete
MKTFLQVLFLIFIFQSYVNADDIRDFQIEGMSIGDSALKYFSKNQIIKNSRDDHYTNNKYTPVQNDYFDFFKTYDAVDFNFLTNDNKFIIVSLSGVIIYENKPIENCYAKMKEIIGVLDTEFYNLEKTDIKTSIHPSPKNKSGESTYTHVYYNFNNGDSISVTCYDYSKEHGSQDHLNLNLQTKEFGDWLIYEAYK